MSTFSENIIYALEQLKRAVCQDNYNLTGSDHDAILIKLQELRDFIEMRYSNHGRL